MKSIPVNMQLEELEFLVWGILTANVIADWKTWKKQTNKNIKKKDNTWFLNMTCFDRATILVSFVIALWRT